MEGWRYGISVLWPHGVLDWIMASLYVYFKVYTTLTYEQSYAKAVENEQYAYYLMNWQAVQPIRWLSIRTKFTRFSPFLYINFMIGEYKSLTAVSHSRIYSCINISIKQLHHNIITCTHKATQSSQALHHTKNVIKQRTKHHHTRQDRQRPRNPTLWMPQSMSPSLSLYAQCSLIFSPFFFVSGFGNKV